MMFNLENPSLYSIYEAGRIGLMPMSLTSQVAEKILRMPRFPISKTHFGKALAASYEMSGRMVKHYPRPIWGITHCKTESGIVEVFIDTVIDKTFCKLLHFKKAPSIGMQEKLLIVAPMAGHFATLLRGTVESLLPYFDVYITDWENARDIPLFEGPFSMADQVDYLKDFFKFFEGDVTVMAVCQPTVGTMVATAYMAYHNDPYIPKNVIVVGGPVDARESPTKVNDFAVDKSLLWFSTHLITRVPPIYAGAMRRVYPGFLQLSGFMSMNLKRHIGSHVEIFQNLVRGDGQKAEERLKFYDEYLAVMDLPAEFYLQTIDEVFHKYSLPLGAMVHHGTPINLANIKGIRLLALEGELDDIAGVGQTKAAIKLCSQLPKKDKFYHLQKGVGHYGIFNGRKFKENVVPVIREFVLKGSPTNRNVRENNIRIKNKSHNK